MSQDEITRLKAQVERLKKNVKKLKKLLASKHKKQYDSGVGDMQKKGGLARAEKLGPERRREIAQKAAQARWKREKK